MLYSLEEIGTALFFTLEIYALVKSLQLYQKIAKHLVMNLFHSGLASYENIKKIMNKICKATTFKGHNQISMMLGIYGHVPATMQEEAMNKINEALQE